MIDRWRKIPRTIKTWNIYSR